MSLHRTLPTTPRLDELIAALVLDGKTRIATEEKSTTLFRFDFSKGCKVIAAEVFQRIDEIKAAVTWATVGTQNKEPAPFLLTSGRLTSNQIRILVPLKPAEALKGAELQLWKGEDYEKTALKPGMTLILEGVHFHTPDDVPFLVVSFPISAH